MTAIIFDVDGTLAETEELHRLSFNQAFADKGANQLWPDARAGWCWSEHLYGCLLKTTGGRERISAYLRDQLSLDPVDFQAIIDEIHATKSQCFARLLAAGPIAPRRGVERIMTMARSLDVGLAIATTTSRSNVDALCRALFHRRPEEIFHAISAGEDVARKKPAPDVYQLTLERLDLQPEACIALEDSRNGMMAAKAAGLRCIVSPSLYMKDESFEEADVVVDEFEWETIEPMLHVG